MQADGNACQAGLITASAVRRWTVDDASIFSVADGKKLAQTPYKPPTFYERLRAEKQQRAALETPLVRGMRLLPELTPGRAMLWGTILAVWGTAAVFASTARSLDIKTVSSALFRGGASAGLCLVWGHTNHCCQHHTWLSICACSSGHRWGVPCFRDAQRSLGPGGHCCQHCTQPGHQNWDLLDRLSGQALWTGCRPAAILLQSRGVTKPVHTRRRVHVPLSSGPRWTNISLAGSACVQLVGSLPKIVGLLAKCLQWAGCRLDICSTSAILCTQVVAHLAAALTTARQQPHGLSPTTGMARNPRGLCLYMEAKHSCHPAKCLK